MSSVSTATLAQRLAAEALGTSLLLATVVGSGIMGERLAGGNAAIALLANAIATGCALYVLITIFGPVSGAHFNPLVTLAERAQGNIAWGDAVLFIVTQAVSATIGVLIAHTMFELPVVSFSQHARTGGAQWFSEFVATFGLLTVILQGTKARPAAVPALVAAYITAAYWFTASTSFANPAVTFARALTDTFSGIRIIDAPMFILAQLVGTVSAYGLFRWMNDNK